MSKCCDGVSEYDCDGINSLCESCKSCYCYCLCPCEHHDQEIEELSDGLMAWVCQECGEQTSGFVGQFGVLHRGS
jgi:hypothetical protein